MGESSTPTPRCGGTAARARAPWPRAIRHPAPASLAVAGLLVLATPALAQVSGGVAVQNDYRLRGYSISNGRAVGIVDVSYDHVSGVYANGSVIGGRRNGDDFTVVGLIGNVGYARRLTPRLTFDAGVVHTSQLEHYGAGATGRYAEGYVGLNARNLSARISYSPDYQRDGVKMLYGEADGGFELAETLRLDAHLGYLGCLGYPNARTCYDRVDWRLGLSRRFRRFEAHASISGVESLGGRALRADENPALVLGASWTY